VELLRIRGDDGRTDRHPGERNRIVADPYTLKLVARDQVNQGAAVLLMAAAARAAGIPEKRWIFVHGAALAVERELLDRPDLDRYPAADAAIASASPARARPPPTWPPSISTAASRSRSSPPRRRDWACRETIRAA
jgi:hypothetical protein